MPEVLNGQSEECWADLISYVIVGRK